MKAIEYDINLADSIYSEVLFTIDPDQFADDDCQLPIDLEERHDTKAIAEQVAQEAANASGHEVEVQVYGFWGHNGREYVDGFKVYPQSKVA